MPTVYENLIPRNMAREVIGAMPKESATLRMGRRLDAERANDDPGRFVLPVAAFTNPRYGGRKAATKVEWTAQNVQAEELACTLALPNHYIDDAGYPVWEQVLPLITTAFAEALDMAVFFGTGAPAAFPAGGIAAAAGAAQSDVAGGAPAAIDKAAAVLEAGGIMNGIVASAAIGTALRAAYRAAGALPGEAPAQVLYGWQVSQIADWDATKGDALVGDFNYLLVGVVEDIRFEMSDQAILQDGAGAIIANAFQENLTAMKAWMRVGVALGSPISTQTEAAVVPFEFADWTT